MRFPYLLALLSGLLPAASALNLTVSARSTVAGPPAVTALLPLPDGSRLLCLGSRWVQLGAAGEVRRSVPLGDSCAGLSLSPSGKRLLNADANGLTVWNVADGAQVAFWAAPNALGRGAGGLISDNVALLATPTGIDALNFGAAQTTRQAVYQGKVTALFVSPDGQRAVISDGKKVQLVDTSDFSVLSGMPCGSDCTVKNVNFSADGQQAAALVGQDLIGLRAGFPAVTILRRTDAASGLPQPDNTALTITAAGAESHDFQTGRREKVVLAGGLLPNLAVQSGQRVLALSDKGELLDASLNFKDIKRWPLPAALSGGGLSSGGAVYALSGGQLTLAGKVVPGKFWAVETAGKTTWALRAGTDGGLQLGTLRGDKFTPVSGSPRTATHLSVNFGGSAAVVWDDAALWVASQAQNKVVASAKLAAQARWVTLSPDASRAFVSPGQLQAEEPDVILLATGKHTPIPEPYRPAGGFINSIQVAGNGVVAVIGSRENLDIIDPKSRAVYNGAREIQGGVARFSPDNKWLAYTTRGQAGSSAVLNILNLGSGKIEVSSPQLATFPAFLAWSADSKKIALGASLAGELGSTVTFELK